MLSTSRDHIIPASAAAVDDDVVSPAAGGGHECSDQQRQQHTRRRVSLELVYTPSTDQQHPTSSASGTEHQRPANTSAGSGEFIDLVDGGADLPTVRRFLQDKGQTTDINSRDFRGRSALQIAVRNQHAELVETILQQDGVQIGDSLLVAAREGNLRIVEILLEWIDNHPSTGGDSGSAGTRHRLPYYSAEFSGDVTPLMVAAIYNHVEIVQLFLHRDGPIEMPHKATCICEKCNFEKHRSSAELHDSLTVMNAYRALASPAYLSVASEDPILLAFVVADRLKERIREDPQDADEFSRLSKQCSQFTVDLVAACRTTAEVELLLRQKPVPDNYDAIREDLEYARLYLANDFRLIEFITQSNCQKVLRSIWLGQKMQWLNYKWYEKWIYLLRTLLMFIPMLLLYLFSPPNRLQKPLTIPLNRFIYHTTAFVLFLGCVFLLLADDHGVDLHGKVLEPPEYYIILWTCGLLYEHLRSLYKDGFHRHYSHWVRIYDLVMICLFLTVFLLWVLSYYIAIAEDSFYLPRSQWPWYDPILLAEAIFSVASVTAFCRLLDVLRLSRVLGPLQLSLVRMVSDILQFLAIFFTIIFSFATGITRLYTYYAGSKRYNAQGEVVKAQADNFVTFGPTYKTLFWALFGYGEVDLAAIIVNYTAPVNATAEQLRDDVPKHYFTESVGYCLWGGYHIMAIIVLINMLIAMMSNTYQYIKDNADIEWKYSRSRLWMTYFEKQSTLPPPLNLVPSMSNLYALATWLRTWFRKDTTSDKAAFKMKAQGCYIVSLAEKQKVEQDTVKYKRLVHDLVQRYMYSMGDEHTSTEKVVTYEELDNVKQDLIREIQKLRDQSKVKPTPVTRTSK